MNMSLAYRIAAAMRDSYVFESKSNPESARFIVVPVPFDATASYRKGSALAPYAVLEATHQVDTFDLEFPDNVKSNVYVDDPIREAYELNEIGRHLYSQSLSGNKRSLDALNGVCESVLSSVYSRVNYWIDQNKIPVVIGGDNSTSLGSILSHSKRFSDLSILHFDAHADLRTGFQGIKFSHAAVMSNVLSMTKSNITQVGVRDLSEDEFHLIMNSNGRVIPFFAKDIWLSKQNEPFEVVSDRVASTLSRNVYVCFDMDAFDISMVPNTGTPVPGGLNWWQVNSVIRSVVNSGRKIVGFDINESAADGSDPILAARMLHKLCGWSEAGPRAMI